MIHWLIQLPALLLATALIVLPGLGIAWLLRFRGVGLIAVALAASFSVIALASLLAPLLSLAWGPLPILLTAAAATLVLLPLRAVIRIPEVAEDASTDNRGQSGLFLLIPMAVLGLSFVITVGDPNAISQTYDAVFHYNNTRAILEGASPSSLQASLVWGGSTSFYPSLWHATAAVIAAVSTPVAANNFLALLVVALVWSAAGGYLLRTVFGSDRQAFLFGAVLLAAFPAFPLLLTDWGVIYPTLLSYSLLPIAFASVLQLLGFARQRPVPIVSWVVLAGVLLPMGLAHPSGIYALMVVSLAVLGYRWWQGLKAASTPRRLLLLGVAAVGLVLFIAMWGVGLNSSQWEVIISPSQALGDVLLNSPPRRLPAITVSVLALIGAVVVWRKRELRWLLLPLLSVAALYIVVASLPLESVRTLLGGIWYNDSRRIMAFLPLAVLPVAALGAKQAAVWFEKKFTVRRPLLTFTVLLFIASQLIGMNYARYSVVREYAMNEVSDLITPDEAAMFDYIAANLPEDSKVAGNPWTGTSLVSAVAGSSVVFPHMSGRLSADELYLAEKFNTGDSKVCELIAQFGITHALEFGGMLMLGDTENPGTESQRAVFSGLNDLEQSPHLGQLHSIGEAKLYRVTGCK